MKAELSNIKQDFEKIIKKDVSLKVNTPLNVANANKPKYCTSDRKEPRAMSNYEKYEATSAWKENDGQKNGILQLEKNLPCSSSRTGQTDYKTHDIFKQDKLNNAEFENIELTLGKKRQNSQKALNNDAEVKELKTQVNNLESEVARYKTLSEKKDEEVRLISEENRSLAVKLVEKNGEFQSLHQHISQSNLQINELRNIQQQILG